MQSFKDGFFNVLGQCVGSAVAVLGLISVFKTIEVLTDVKNESSEEESE